MNSENDLFFTKTPLKTMKIWISLLIQSMFEENNNITMELFGGQEASKKVDKNMIQSKQEYGKWGSQEAALENMQKYDWEED